MTADRTSPSVRLEPTSATPQPAKSDGPQPASTLLASTSNLPTLLTYPNIHHRGKGPVWQTALLEMQRSLGNRVTGRLLQRQPASSQGGGTTFQPQVKAEVGSVFALLNGDTTLGVNVSNARKAPPGTTFAWSWGQLDKTVMAPGPTKPPVAAQATLHAKAKKVGSTDAIPELETTPPSGVATKKRTATVPITVMEPAPVWKPATIRPGPLGPGKARKLDHMFAGDTVVQQVTFDQVENARDAGLDLHSYKVAIGGRAGDFLAGAATWVGANTLQWTISCSLPGESLFTFSVQAPGQAEPMTQDLDLKAVADATLFKARCGTAESTLNTAHAAGRKWFMDAFQNYITAHNNHNAALKAQTAANELMGQLLLNVLLAPIGGAAGGAIGGLFKNAEKTMQAAFSNVQIGAITDATKDLVKAATREGLKTGVKLSEGGHGGGAAIDPLNWLARIDGAIAAEREQAGQVLTALQNNADQAIATNPDKEFDWDPVEVVMEGATLAGQPLTNLGPVPTDLYYERKMWAVWLEHYAYKLVYYPSDVPFGAGHAVEENVGSKLFDEIDRVAKKFGENGKDWIRQYGEPSRQAAEAEKKKMEGD